MKVAIKNKREMKYIDAKDVIINNTLSLNDIYERQLTLEKMFNDLVELLKKNIIVNSDKEYVIEIDGKLKKIEKLKLYDVPVEKIDLKLYKVLDGKLVLDKNKIGGAV